MDFDAHLFQCFSALKLEKEYSREKFQLYFDEVIEVPQIEEDCQAPTPCSNLYLYNARDRVRFLEVLQGDHKEIKNPRWSNGVKNVAIVQVFGEHGSYTIYKKKNFKGESLCLDEVGRLVNLEDEGFESTVIR